VTHAELAALLDDRIATVDALIASKNDEHRRFLTAMNARKAKLLAIKEQFRNVDLEAHFAALNILAGEGLLTGILK
jgi:uncharacterized protein YegJ (DUF2314 family)